MITFNKKDETKASVDTWEYSISTGQCLKNVDFCVNLMVSLMASVPDKEDAQVTCTECGVNFAWKIAKLPITGVERSIIENSVDMPFTVDVDMRLDGTGLIEIRRLFEPEELAFIIKNLVNDLKDNGVESVVKAVSEELLKSLTYSDAKAALLKKIGELGYIESDEPETKSEQEEEPEKPNEEK